MFIATLTIETINDLEAPKNSTKKKYYEKEIKSAYY